MNQNLKLSLGKLKNLETLYFASQALVASEMLPEEIRKSEYFKNFAKSYDDWVVAFQKAKTNTLTVELVDKFAKIGKLVACIKVIIDSYCNVLILGDLDANQKALSILSKYKMISKGNRFDIISWTKHFTNELNELGKDNCELMGIQIYIETIQKYLSEYEALYKERSIYSEMILGEKHAARDALECAWKEFWEYVQMYNKYSKEDSCNEFIKAINALKKNGDNLDRKASELNSTTEESIVEPETNISK